ncbi:four-carbon acid sugar kinase family protein [Cytobacillus firmus]|uniref:four-carbon acid sugar kinase family protein n=1 Tax=Cytobacillus firmus TaxID=1399 RepID=UPI001C8DE134|nr:four-carbon acid sugar kinase family protein [Cytobacillus firmus]MBX9974785.1 four-carbon acid sugar kinase family protein [Cytobacillus firmus]
MFEKFGIIADDLTGANDSGVQLVKKGLAATVMMDFTGKNIQSDPDVLIVDTDSRAKTQEESYEAVEKAASLLFEKGYAHVYKKVDSTLRGNISVELAALEKVYRPEIVVIAPAFPKMNRTTVSGHHYVNGKLITETEFGRDPKTPVTESFLPLMLKKYAGKDIALLDLDLIRGDKADILEFIEEAVAAGKNWIVCDSEREEDLQVIAEVFTSLQKKTIWTGSGALVEYLPDALKLRSHHENEYEDNNIRKTLTISGSLSQVTKKQLSRIRELDQSYFAEINPVQLVNHSIDLEAVIEEIGQNQDKNHFVVYVDSSNQNRDAARIAGEAIGLSGRQIGERIAMGLGQLANRLVNKFPELDGLILTGGDIAKAACSELGIQEMELHAEIEPGLPFGRLRSKEKSYLAVTKAGGFGNEQSLVNAIHYMTRKVECNESN